MSVFSSQDYRRNLRFLISRMKSRGERRTLTDLAEAIRVQRPYLSKVVNGYAELSTDQMYLACKYLGCSPEESRFMQLLLEYARTGVKDRKAEVLAEIRELQQRHLEIKGHLDAEVVQPSAQDLTQYYTDPVTQMVHVALTIPRFQRQPALLAAAVGIQPGRLQKVLRYLESIRFIEFSHGGYKSVRASIHLGRDSALYSPHQALMRLKALEQIQNLDPKDYYSFAVTFSADESTQKAIQQDFIEFLKRIETRVKEAPADNLYQISFDLFPWLR